MAIQFFDRRGNETDPNGNEIIRGLSSDPKNRASGYSVVYKKKKTQAAAAGSPPPPPPTRGPKGPNWPNKDNDKKEPAKETKKKPPEGGLGALVKNRK
jgi:hypothetical protein